jgi:hypothetical protein
MIPFLSSKKTMCEAKKVVFLYLKRYGFGQTVDIMQYAPCDFPRKFVVRSSRRKKTRTKNLPKKLMSRFFKEINHLPDCKRQQYTNLVP